MNKRHNMELFSTRKSFIASDEFVPIAMRAIMEHFQKKGFTYKVRTESYSRTVVQIQQGGILLQTAGMRRGAVVIFRRYDGRTEVEVRDCIVRNQVVGPAILSHYVPKLRAVMFATATVGLAMQANLAKELMAVVEHSYCECSGFQGSFCPYCGTRISAGEGSCSFCGKSVAAMAIEQ